MSPKVLRWRLSNSMDADFCVGAFKEALAKYGAPEIYNTPLGRFAVQISGRAMEQGGQFTGSAWTDVLTDAKIKISIGGKGGWRSLKDECVYLNPFETSSEMRASIGRWYSYYNSGRPLATHGMLTPDEACESRAEPIRLAA